MTEYTFHKLLCYLYTDEIPPVSADKCLNLLELANRLCLPRLLNLIECRVIENLTKVSQNETSEAVELCLKLLEPVKVMTIHVIYFESEINEAFCYCFSFTMLISSLNGACHTCVSITTAFAVTHPNLSSSFIPKIRNISGKIVGHPCGI